MAQKSNRNLLLLLEHPQEPVFIPKGPNAAVFDIPSNYFPDKYKPITQVLTTRFGERAQEKIQVKKISIPPLGEILDLKRDDNFSLFLVKHQRIAALLIEIFMGMRDVDDLLSMAVYARDRVNPYLFNYAFSVVLLHRKDTRNLDLPSFARLFPDKYVDSKIFTRAREEAKIVPEGSRTPIVIPKDFTASQLEEEQRLAYFREDLGANLHHWHWHLVYPLNGERRIVAKNRRGELFYYMHQQIIARYNFERLCNKLKRVERLKDFGEPIKEAYFPKLDSVVASRPYPARVANQKLQNINRAADEIRQDVEDLKRWSDRILDSIHKGAVNNEKGQTILLTESEGIDVLGNIIESSVLSPNRTYYGDLHNAGHVFLAYIHDPDHRYLETFGVMGDVATAMRDPVFYRWHSYIDDIFQEHKNTLPRYSDELLNYPGVRVTKVEIQSQGAPANVFNTFWKQSDIDLSRGMDFQEEGAVFVRFTHLQHQSFQYSITVNNSNPGMKMGTCRIFLAPKFDERGNTWSFREQKIMFIELDKFTVTLKQGMNTITRDSNDSSVTIPFERSFRDLDTNRPMMDDSQLDQFNFCGCGWPHHLLIPKGTAEGMPCELFVMISNYDDDRVEQSMEGICNDAGSYCGIKDKLYPDRRSMGYPFDRLARDGVVNLQQFLTPNMRVADVTIKFNNKVVKPKQDLQN